MEIDCLLTVGVSSIVLQQLLYRVQTEYLVDQKSAPMILAGDEVADFERHYSQLVVATESAVVVYV